MVRITNENDDLEISVSQGLPVVQADIVIGPSYYLSEAIYRDTDAYIVSLMLHGGSGKLFWIEHYKPMPLPVVKKWPSTDLLVPGGEADISKWEEALRDRGL